MECVFNKYFDPSEVEWSMVETLIFNDDSCSIDSTERIAYLCLSKLSILLIYKIIIQTTGVHRINFCIGDDHSDWLEVLMFCLSHYSNLTELNLGRLTFRGCLATRLYKFSETLKTFTLHRIEENFPDWFSDFMNTMNIKTLIVDHFTLHTPHDGYMGCPFPLYSYKLETIRVKGDAYVLLSDDETEVDFRTAPSNMDSCFAFSGIKPSPMIDLYVLTELVIRDCSINDRDFIEISTNVTSLLKLDISGCVRLSHRGLNHLENLTNLTDLSLGYLDVEYESIQSLTDLKYLDVSYIDPLKIQLFSLMYNLLELRTVVSCGNVPRNVVSREIRNYIRSDIGSLNRRVDKLTRDITLYSETVLIQILQSSNIPGLNLVSITDGDVSPAIKQVYLDHNTRRSDLCQMLGYWLRRDNFGPVLEARES